jgi:hypothetical protein
MERRVERRAPISASVEWGREAMGGERAGCAAVRTTTVNNNSDALTHLITAIGGDYDGICHDDRTVLVFYCQ